MYTLVLKIHLQHSVFVCYYLCQGDRASYSTQISIIQISPGPTFPTRIPGLCLQRENFPSGFLRSTWYGFYQDTAEIISRKRLCSVMLSIYIGSFDFKKQLRNIAYHDSILARQVSIIVSTLTIETQGQRAKDSVLSVVAGAILGMGILATCSGL